ncbi:DWNN-domain-containing protein [Rickenella mellea]|uniref:DWNN-domain-containing protein n=1 Tax=Rickenella mellea TaxID=50990 RepID=A0A4Y7Q7F9_9AGAM|nr:DWNN-domain-containing protein [Rickenella mellea]
MSSAVFYKFKSQRDESKVSFDGTGISVFDLKKEIILANNLKANDFDLLLLDPRTEQEYKDDSDVIPRNSSVIAKRIPASKPGKGKAALYISEIPLGSAKDKQATVSSTSQQWNRGMGQMSKRFDGKDVKDVKPRPNTPNIAPSIGNDDEAKAMAAMFQAQTENWEETQEKMSHAQKIYNSRGGSRGGKQFVARQPQHYQTDRPLPPGYVCYRCGQKGHWIHDCPTNNDREFDHKPRIKRTTGIPRSFLKAVDQPSEGLPGQGVMVTPDGGYVVAQPDLASWQKQVSRPKVLTAADIRDRPSTDSSLVCPIDNKLFRDAVKTPCCGALYCEECIQTHLLENDFTCPNCGKKVPSLDRLVMDKPTRTKVADYIDKAIKESQEIEESGPSDVVSESVQANTGDVGFVGNNEAADYSLEQQQPGIGDVSLALAESIPQLQAQISQISVMLQNPSLPPSVRHSTQFQYQQLQMQLQQAQTFAVLAAGMSAQNVPIQNFNPQGFSQNEYQTQWTHNPFTNQQPAGQDSAYQRLPVNNRRRNLKRERPSDFLEISGGDGQGKAPRYWE